MKRPALYALAVAANQPLGTGEHFLCGASRKREQEYSLSGHAALDQVCNPVDQSAGLSGTGAGNDE
jgi:hypothetical protein